MVVSKDKILTIIERKQIADKNDCVGMIVFACYFSFIVGQNKRE